jgi:hypothetical protein
MERGCSPFDMDFPSTYMAIGGSAAEKYLRMTLRIILGLFFLNLKLFISRFMG